MTETILERDGIRVVAELDNWPPQPEHMGWPELILTWDMGWHLSAQSWDNVIDADAVERAARELDDMSLARWLRIHARDLVDWDALDFTADDLADGVTVDVGTAHGYAQGDMWLVVQWRPKVSEHWDSVTFDPEESELVNWARGDAWVPTAEEWDPESETWQDVHLEDPCPTLFAADPTGNEYVQSEAETVWRMAADMRSERLVESARVYYEALAVTQ